MRSVVITDPPRAEAGLVAELGAHGVSTVHEAQVRTGYLGPLLRPIQHGVRTAGTAVTALCWPDDNLTIHIAVEQCRPGDILVVTTTSPNTAGMFGELLATSLQARGVLGLVAETGVRDIAELNEMSFPVWSAAVSAQGTVKARAGSVNVPISVGGETVHPGDAIVADDDGVVCVPRQEVKTVLAAAKARTDTEGSTRRALSEGELGLDLYGIRPKLEKLGVEYLSAEEANDDEV